MRCTVKFILINYLIYSGYLCFHQHAFVTFHSIPTCSVTLYADTEMTVKFSSHRASVGVVAHLAERSHVWVGLLVNHDNGGSAHACTHSSLGNNNVGLAHTSTHAHVHAPTHSSLGNNNGGLPHTSTHTHALSSVAHLLVHHGLLITHALLSIAHLLWRILAHLLLPVSHLRLSIAHLLLSVAHLLLSVAHLLLSVAHLLAHNWLLLVAHAHRLLHSHSGIDDCNAHASIHKLGSEVQSTSWSSVEKDFDPLLSPTRDRKSAKWYLSRSNNRCAVSS